MKYFLMTAYTPFCGEELSGVYKASSPDELRANGEADELISECIDSFVSYDEWEDQGFDSHEEYLEYYYSSSGVDIEEITKEQYDEYVKKGW